MAEFIVERLNGQKWEEHVYVQELIRCRDCEKKGKERCPMVFAETQPSDYCSYAEMKR